MKRQLALVSRVVLGVVFIAAAWSKLVDPRTFAEEIANYQVLPPALVPFFAAVLPGIELIAGLALTIGLWTRTAAALLTALLVAFICALSQALLRGIDLRCGCFGGADLATWGTVARDAGLLVPGVLTLWLGPGQWAVETKILPISDSERPAPTP